jgi:oligogalacturonide transport system substrate-binding protein
MKHRVSILAGLGIVLMTSVAANATDLRFSWWGGDSRHEATQKAAAYCGEKHGHNVSAEFGGFGGYQEKLTTQLAGGTEPDIMQVNWPWLPLMSKDGTGFADLSTLAELDTSAWPATVLETGMRDGKLNGLPVSTTGRVFFVNKTAFEKAGIAVPTTWQELIDATPAFKSALGDDAYPFYATGLDALLVVSLVVAQQTGKDLVDPATNQVAWTAEELAKGLDFYKSLVDAGTISSWADAAAAGNTNLFERPDWIAGKIGSTYQWDSTYTQYAGPLADGQELVPIKLLTVDGAASEGVYRKPSMVWSISKNAKDPVAAATILDCLVNDPEAITLMGDQRGLPSSETAAKQLLDSGKISAQLVEANSFVMAASGPTVSPYNEDPEVRDIFQSTLEEFAYGQIDAATAAQTIIDGVNARLGEL